MIAHELPRHHSFRPAWQPFAFALVAILATILAWVVFTPRSVTGPQAPLVAPSPMGEVHSVAYSVPGDGYDRLYVRDSRSGEPHLVAMFPYAYDLHARGLASPIGDRVAVLSLGEGPGSPALLTLVDLPAGIRRETPARFDYLSALAWRPDGSGVVGVLSSTPDEAGRVEATVVEAAAADGAPVVRARFDNVLQVAPVGFSFDGARLFVVVIDQSGSSLWSVDADRMTRVAAMSPGRTRDWSLSPDGARLAFVDVVSAGDRSYVGRTLTIATGAIRAAGPGGDQFAPAWIPGSDVPVFGGPGGSIQLSAPAAGPVVVVPARWAPDGRSLVATMYPAAGDRSAALARSIEVLPFGPGSAIQRLRLSAEEGASFFGWVRDVQ